MASTEDIIFEIIKDTFDFDGQIDRTTTSEDVDGWDSLGHVTLLIMVQRHFKVSITESQRDNLQDVGELIDLVDSLSEKIQ